MKTEMIDIGRLSSRLSITIEADDYQNELAKQLKKHKDSAHLKGFRKGKAPLSVIKKFYGKGIMAELIDKKIQNAVSDYIIDNKIDILGSPMPVDDNAPDINLDHHEDMTFSFDLGMVPEVTLKGIDASDTYEGFTVKVEESLVDEEFTHIQRKLGQQNEVVEPIEKMDLVKLTIQEKEPVDAEQCHTGTITVLVERLTSQYQEAMLGKRKGDKLEINVYELEENATEDYARKYFLQDAPDDVTPVFDAEITSVTRLEPAQLNEEFFKKAFGNEEIVDEAKARKHLREHLQSYFDKQTDQLARRNILTTLVEKNEMDFPKDFLKRWILFNNKEAVEEEIERDYPAMEKNLRWTVIKNKLTEQENIQISDQEIRQHMKFQFMAQLRQWGYSSLGDINIDDIVEKMMSKQDDVEKAYDEIRSERVMDAIVAKINIERKEISKEAFEKMVEEINQNNA